MARLKQKPKRNKPFDPDRYSVRPRSVDADTLAKYDELLWWLQCGAEGSTPERPMAESARTLAGEARDGLRGERVRTERDAPSLAGCVDEVMRWLDAGAQGIVPPEPLSGVAAKLAGSLLAGFQQTRSQRARG